MSVQREGLVAAGDGVRVLARDPGAASVSDFVRVYGFDRGDAATLQRLIAVAALPAKWRDRFERQLATVSGPPATGA